MNQLQTLGIILRRTNYQEADRILTILTDTEGKLSAIAKGARRSKSKLAGGIELFALNELTLIKGKSNLFTITSSRVKKQFGDIVKDIDRTMKAYEYIKLIDKIVDDHADVSDYFELLHKGLAGLNDLKLDSNMVDIWFYLYALNQSGVLPNLRQDNNNQPLDEEHSYNFSVSDMTFIKTDNGTFTGTHIKLLRVAIRYNSAQKLSNIKVDNDISETCSNISRSMAEHHLM